MLPLSCSFYPVSSQNQRYEPCLAVGIIAADIIIIMPARMSWVLGFLIYIDILQRITKNILYIFENKLMADLCQESHDVMNTNQLATDR